MHQPYYKDDLTRTYLLPWVRLRAAKDYYKMAAILDDYPRVRQTFNLVPSLLAQIEDYTKGDYEDLFLNLARRPAAYPTAASGAAKTAPECSSAAPGTRTPGVASRVRADR